MNSIKRILIVEDEIAHFELIERGFERRQSEFTLKRAVNISEALIQINLFNPHLIISDWKLPDGNGTELILKDSRGNTTLPIILMTSYGNENFAVEALKLGVVDYIVKSPETFSDMVHICERTFREWEAILEKRKMEDRIRKLSSAVEQSKVIVMITDIYGTVEYVNPKFEQVTGYSINEVVGRKASLIKSDSTDPEIFTNLWLTIKSGKEWKGEFLNKKKDGDLYWEAVTITPIRDENGYITNFLKIGEDITESKNLQIELEKALLKAEESVRLKNSILANMNHELRTPLMVILGMNQLLIDEITDDSHKQMLERVIESGKRLMNTLNSILDLSEIESDKTSFKLTEYSLDQNLEILFTSYAKKAKERELNFNYQINSNGLIILVYERFFEQTLVNLIDNAIKYTPTGSINITVDKVIIDNQSWAKFCIKDTGIGIAKENLDLIFEEFRQVSEGMNRSFEGSGLGLTVVKKMIEVMHGNIEVESELGKGSVFTVRFPVIYG